FVGTFALVFVGGASIAAGGGLVGVALAHGIILAVMVSATMRISGHLNPSITIGFLAARRIDPMMAGVYIAGQILGAIAAAGALLRSCGRERHLRGTGRLLDRADRRRSGGGPAV